MRPSGICNSQGRLEESKHEVDIQFFEKSFHELCQKSRREKKPILIMMLRDNTDGTY